MRLIGIPDVSGAPASWINSNHLASVRPLYTTDARGDLLAVELNVEGLPLHKVKLGEFESLTAAQASWTSLLYELQQSLQLVEIPGASGSPMIWVSPAHIVSVRPLYTSDGSSHVLFVELKVEGLPLHRGRLGEFESRAAAQEKWAWFVEELQQEVD